MADKDDKKLEEKVFSTFLSDEEKLKIQKEVEFELDAENKKKVAKEYKDGLISAAKKKALMRDAKHGEDGDGLVSVFIDLPSVTECIRLDGIAYYPGRSYNVTPEVRAVLEECMHRGQVHEDEVSGRKDSNAYRTRKQQRIQLT